MVNGRAPSMHLEPCPPALETPAQRTLNTLMLLLIGISAVAVFIPLNPRMPHRGLDASWQYAMNEAVTRDMTFGKQIVFTYGPLASIGTRTYSPDTDRRMMAGGMLLGLCYMLGLFYLCTNQRRFVILALLLFLATFGGPELQLLSFSFLVAICCVKYVESDQGTKSAFMFSIQALAAILMWAALGFLPLVKGSLLLPFAGATFIPSALFLSRGRPICSILAILVPITSTIVLWKVAGQPAGDLAPYLRGMALLTSGYTEAMSTSWLILPAALGGLCILLFLVTAAFIITSVSGLTHLRVSSRWALAALCTVFLLVLFKHGFVKADALPSAFTATTVLILVLGLLKWNRALTVSVTVALLMSLATAAMGDFQLANEVHQRFGKGLSWTGQRRTDIFIFCAERAFSSYSRTTYKATWKTYESAWSGVRARLRPGDDLKLRFHQAEADIRNSYTLPQLVGSGDLYTFDESLLLASGDRWNPRPVFQSYSVYTPELIEMNEQHLRAEQVPDWLLFELQTIDGRLPSLDDGASWPAFLDNYKLVSYDREFALMQRRATIIPQSHFAGISRQICRVGDQIPIPTADGPVFAEVDMEPTLTGRLMMILFDPPQLQVLIVATDGTINKYRVVSSMMKNSFLLSPLVRNTNDFVLFMDQREGSHTLPTVKAFAIAPVYGGSFFWSSTYQLTLKKYDSRVQGP